VPKGAVMTNRRWNNFICAPYLMPDPCVTLSFAPLAHVAERQSMWLTMGFGGHFGFASGDMTTIFDDVQ
jgi:long-subunit acyl-CoA synthetase (AMP-forming)